MHAMGKKGREGQRRPRNDRGKASTSRYTVEEEKEILRKAAEVGESFNAPTEWLTVYEAAANIKRDWREVYNLIKEGEIPSYRVGPRSIRIDRAELDAWVRTNEWTEEANRYIHPRWRPF